MGGALDKYLGIMLIAIILFYLFRNPSGTSAIFNALSAFNVSAISALQGQGAYGGVRV